MSILSALFGGGAACSEEAGWEKVAAHATYLAPRQVEGARRALAGLDRGQREQAEQALDRIAAVTPGLAGLNEAQRVLREALPGMEVPGSKVDGTEPAVAALKGAALCAFQGLVVATGQRIRAQPDVEQAVALVRFTREIDLFGQAGSAVLREEAQVGLGGDLYTQALRALGGAPAP